MGRVKAVLLSCLVLVATSCDGIFGSLDNIGKPVQFGISSGPTTKTAYSNEYDGRMDWVDGDRVSIYMGWEGGESLENADYEVYLDQNIGRRSYGRLSPLGESLKWHGYFRDGRAWEYDHTFYSAYPARPFDGSGFTFNLPSNQSGIGMDKAYMVAYEEGINSASSGGHAELHYYPMITTLCVTVSNSANLPIGTQLGLSSTGRPIAGTYRADISRGYWVVEGGETTLVSSSFSVGQMVMFFIIPRDYGENELQFILGGTEKPIPVALNPGYKYYIRIDTAESVPEVSGRMTDAAAQLIAGILGFGNGGQGLKDLMNQYLSGCYSDSNYFNNAVWNNFLNNIRSKLPNVTAADFDMFSDQEWECIKNLLRSLTKLEVNNGNYLNVKLTKKDFELFPNIQEIEMLYEQDVEIELDGWPKLTTVTIKGNGKVVLTVKSCPELTSITLNAHKESRADVDKVTCPKYTG